MLNFVFYIYWIPTLFIKVYRNSFESEFLALGTQFSKKAILRGKKVRKTYSIYCIYYNIYLYIYLYIFIFIYIVNTVYLQ